MTTKKIISATGIFLAGALTAFLILKLVAPNTQNTTNKPSKPEVVCTGEVLSSINTAGVVEPENEFQLTAPMRSAIKDILVTSGQRVSKGDALIELDEDELRKELKRMQDQLTSRQNSLNKVQLNNQSTKLGLATAEKSRQQQVEQLEKALATREQQFKAGKISAAEIENTRQSLETAREMLATLIEKNGLRIKQMEAAEQNLRQQIKQLRAEIVEKGKKLKHLTLVAPTDGIILEITANKGDRVEENRPLVRMWELGSYKVRGTVNDTQASKITPGKKAKVGVDNEQLDGIVSSANLMPNTNQLAFTIHLEANKHPGLKENQSVAVQIILDYRKNVPRISRRPEIGSNQHRILVLKNNETRPTEVILGVVGDQWCEVLSGLQEGDEFKLLTQNK